MVASLNVLYKMKARDLYCVRYSSGHISAISQKTFKVSILELCSFPVRAACLNINKNL